MFCFFLITQTGDGISFFFFFSSRRRHTRSLRDWSSDVCSSDLLIGPNGAGKTTAFNVITRLYRIDSGDIVFDGKSLLHTAPSHVVRLGIARTFQSVELCPTMTVLENVLVGAHTVSRFRSERTVRASAHETL